MRTTEDERVEALREAADRLGESPTKARYEDLGLTPASATIIRVMGGWNEAKERAGLETYRSSGSRIGSKPDHVDLPDGAEWVDLSVDQRWHYRNVDWNTERTLRRRARRRSWVNEVKSERGCTRCNEDDPASLDFHHLHPGGKEMAVTSLITRGYGKEKLRAEMVNCEVLCANCHRQAHSDRFAVVDDGQRSNGDDSHKPSSARRRVRKWAYEYKRAIGGCTRCDEDDPVCLDFHHHGDEKNGTVARMISDGRPRDEVARELANCRVLCANCHRKEHFEPPGSDG